MTSTSPAGNPDDGPLEVLWHDGERLYRSMWRDMDDGSRREFLVAQPCAEHPTPGAVSGLAHEYGLKDYLDQPWALRPLELVRERGQTMLVFESTRARPLDERRCGPADRNVPATGHCCDQRRCAPASARSRTQRHQSQPHPDRSRRR